LESDAVLRVQAGDLNTKRARVDNQDSLPGDLAVIHAKAPLAEVTKYAAQLGSITQGRGRTR
jgi:elongation factor G